MRFGIERLLYRIVRAGYSDEFVVKGATLARRGADWPAELPVGLSETFAASAAKQAQWAGFLRTFSESQTTPTLATVVETLRGFLTPVLQVDASTEQTWSPDGPWR